MAQSLAFISTSDRSELRIIDEWFCVLLRGGGFRPCHVAKVRTRLGSDVSERLIWMDEPYQSWQLAREEARYQAEKCQVKFRDWP